MTVYFLFQGAQPLQVTLYTPRPFTAAITPVANPALHQRLLRSWWKEYSGPRKLFNIPDEHPPEVENYLRWTLARRLGIEGPGQRPATSQIDTESERLIQQSLGLLMRGRTCFVIAHRLSTISRADVIVVIEQGRISQIGTHSELMSKGGKYRSMVEQQIHMTLGNFTTPTEMDAGTLLS